MLGTLEGSGSGHEPSPGVMHTLFELEESCGASLVCESDATYLTFPAGSELGNRLSEWGKAFAKYRDGFWTEEEYIEWKSTYPESVIADKEDKK